jgi:hypothetical protein
MNPADEPAEAEFGLCQGWPEDGNLPCCAAVTLAEPCAKLPAMTSIESRTTESRSVGLLACFLAIFTTPSLAAANPLNPLLRYRHAAIGAAPARPSILAEHSSALVLLNNP